MKLNSYLIIVGSFFIGFLLTIIKLPALFHTMRPAWIALLICYWTLATPHQINALTAWTSGIILDGLNNTLLGEHAFSLTVIAWLVYKFHRQIKMFPTWQQSIIIMLIIFVYLFLLFWVESIIGQLDKSGSLWKSAISSALIWPLLIHMMRSWRHRHRIYLE